MIWVPVAGQGGYRYRDTLAVLTDAELVEAANAAFVGVEGLVHGFELDASAELWRTRSGALTCYAMWAIGVMRERHLGDNDVLTHRMSLLAQWQSSKSAASIPGVRPSLWLVPDWWGSEIHEEHRARLDAQYQRRWTGF